jgi:NAD(P)-dependent dehydrogenase (short-subunit alcohol dehydrogenase family)
VFDLRDKVVIVTGSSRGIGKAIAWLFAKAGAKVVISSRDAQACEAVVRELKQQGHEAIALACHVGRKDQLRSLVDNTVSHWGKVDVLVCNAATNPVFGTLKDIDDGAFDKIMSTNVKSVLQLCNMICPLMAANGSGSVILMSSIAALRGNREIGAYGVSKAALAALTRNLAVEWGPQGIRVNAIAPGLVKTDFARALWEDPDRLKRAESRTPLRRIGEPNDIAGVALFLATQASAYVTGEMIVADGGETIS